MEQREKEHVNKPVEIFVLLAVCICSPERLKRNARSKSRETISVFMHRYHPLSRCERAGAREVDFEDGIFFRRIRERTSKIEIYDFFLSNVRRVSNLELSSSGLGGFGRFLLFSLFLPRLF